MESKGGTREEVRGRGNQGEPERGDAKSPSTGHSRTLPNIKPRLKMSPPVIVLPRIAHRRCSLNGRRRGLSRGRTRGRRTARGLLRAAGKLSRAGVVAPVGEWPKGTPRLVFHLPVRYLFMFVLRYIVSLLLFIG